VLLAIFVVGCVTSRETLVRRLEARHGCTDAIRVTRLGFDDNGLEMLRADGCARTTYYQCSSRPRSARSCCETLDDSVQSRGARFPDSTCGD
jgi:hypothetical protein